MAVRLPEGWRGSDLRTRGAVVRYLAERGGKIADPSGRAASRMRDELGFGRALGQVLAAMENDGMLRREIRGRRTLELELLDGWGLEDGVVPAGSHAHAELSHNGDHASTDGSGEIPDGVDYGALAETLLSIVVTKATAPAPGSREVREAAKRAEQAEREQRALEAKLRETNERLREAEADAQAAWEQAKVLGNNLEATRAELSSPGRRRGGVAVADAISPEAKAALAQLASRLPAKKRAG